MFKFFKHLSNVIAFNQLDESKRKIVFYSEGKNYWVHLQGMIKHLLANYDIPICYVSSGSDDPGLELSHKNLQSFKIDDGWIRNWFFENLQADIMVMTMPDIGQYQVKRSRHDVHYVYTQHSLVSLHMVYRFGAHDHYNSIFCAAPHHKIEIRAMEKVFNLKKKDLYEHGYERLDAIITSTKNRKKTTNSPKHVLLAPSWGENSILELMGSIIVDKVLANGFNLTLRPHPQTIIFAKGKVDEIVMKHKDNPLFNYEANVAGQESLHNSDIMICDWSGAALGYAFGLNKPVVFIDVPRKVNNEHYKNINIEPFEVSIRDKIGTVVAMDDIDNIASHIENTIIKYDGVIFDHNIYSLTKAGAKGAELLNEILKKINQ
ncbi:MAG: CDP-glycerol glycerophosphotransferase family protein [Proteobacteria bacterium]|nr:CDP-glycerol glycerophosphotransferase family protein [Pseudomonadota bacterium]